jgi:biotin carboxyl carrier protein
VLNVLVGQGDTAEVGQPLVLLEAMKMELTVTADVDGTVTSVHVAPGDLVEGAQLLLEIAPADPS